MQLPVSWLLLLHLWTAAVDCEQKLLCQLLQLLLLLLRLLLQPLSSSCCWLEPAAATAVA